MRKFNLGSQVWRAVAVAGFAWLAADSATAQDCAQDADCSDGFVCHSEQYETCVRVCNGDDNCQPRTCETSQFAYCANAPCDADADCPTSMRCYAPTWTSCSGSMGGAGGSASSGTGGIGAPADECHEEVGDATCVARYALPCATAADCGPGFACEEQIYSVCSGGYMNGIGGYGGAGGAPAGAYGGAGGAPDFECHEESTGTSACRLLEVACESNSDCDDSLECQTNPNYWPCGGGVGAGGARAMMGGAGGATIYYGTGGVPAMIGAGGAGGGDASGCTPSAAPSMICAPPNYYGYGGGMYPGSYGGAGGASGGYAGGGAGGASAAADPNNDSSNVAGSTGNGNHDAVAGPGGGAAGNSKSGDSTSDISNSGSSTDESEDVPPEQGCSVSGNDAGAQLSNWATLIGLVAFGLRRRARRLG